MQTPDTITLPEVAAVRQSARFYKDQDGRALIEISFVGQKDNLVEKVTPGHMAKYRDAWNAFCDGRPLEPRPGTPLTDVAGVDELIAQALVARNVHNADELAVLSDADCQALGHGTLTQREAARKLIALRKLEGDEATRNALNRAVAHLTPAPAEAPVAADLAGIRQGLAETSDLLRQFIATVTPLIEGRAPARKSRQQAAPPAKD